MAFLHEESEDLKAQLAAAKMAIVAKDNELQEQNQRHKAAMQVRASQVTVASFLASLTEHGTEPAPCLRIRSR